MKFLYHFASGIKILGGSTLEKHNGDVPARRQFYDSVLECLKS